MAKVKRSGNVGPRRNCGKDVVGVREDSECNFENYHLENGEGEYRG
jgi:hypothetical protein